jgi:hypothetical protein
MRMTRMRIAVSAAALATMAGTVVPAMSAAAATPDTSTAGCGAASVWLKVWGATGEHCYTGAGTLAVNLPGVYKAQVLGSHQACLIATSREACGTGPAVLFINPAIGVRSISMIGV